MTILIKKTNPLTNEDISISRVTSGYHCGVGNGLKTLTSALTRQDDHNNAADMVAVSDVNWSACTDTERDAIIEFYRIESKARQARDEKNYPAGHAFLSAVLPIYAGWIARGNDGRIEIGDDFSDDYETREMNRQIEESKADESYTLATQHEVSAAWGDRETDDAGYGYRR